MNRKGNADSCRSQRFTNRTDALKEGAHSIDSPEPIPLHRPDRILQFNDCSVESLKIATGHLALAMCIGIEMTLKFGHLTGQTVDQILGSHAQPWGFEQRSNTSNTAEQSIGIGDGVSSINDGSISDRTSRATSGGHDGGQYL